MSQQIAMNEIPFAPVLGDTIPPTQKPRDPLPTKRPRAHNVVAWRIEGGITSMAFDTLEAAQGYARALCYAVFYKYAIMSGRDLVERGDIVASAADIAAQSAFRAFLERQGKI